MDEFKDDKLIAEFMGLIYIPWNDLQGYSCPGWWKTNYDSKVLHLTKNHRSKLNGFICRHVEGYYRWDWNKLMTVIDKIEDLVFDNVKTNIVFGRNSFVISIPVHNEMFSDRGKTRIEATFKTIVEFIKWYNENMESKTINFKIDEIS